MYNKSTSHHDHRPRHAEDRHPNHDRRSGSAHRRAATSAEYTLGHAGRQVRVGPVAVWPSHGTVILGAPPDREARLEPRALPSAGGRVATNGSAGIEGTLAKLQASLDRIEASQITSLNGLEESYDAKARRMRGVLVDLGL